MQCSEHLFNPHHSIWAAQVDFFLFEDVNQTKAQKQRADFCQGRAPQHL